MKSDLERLSDEYENAEAEFLSGLEDAWMPLDDLTERTEVLHELRNDIARLRGVTGAHPQSSAFPHGGMSWMLRRFVAAGVIGGFQRRVDGTCCATRS